MERAAPGAGWLLFGFGASLSLILLMVAPRLEYDQGTPRYDFSVHNASYRPGLAMVSNPTSRSRRATLATRLPC